MTTTKTLTMSSDEKPNGKKSFPKLPQDIGTDYSFKRQIVWKNVLGFIVLHLSALYGLYLACFKASALTFFYGKYTSILISFMLSYTTFTAIFMAFVSGEGITVGAHRLYSHKTFKAKFITRFILMILQTVAGQVRKVVKTLIKISKLEVKTLFYDSIIL